MATIPENILINNQKVAPAQAIEDFNKKGLKVTATAEETAAAVQARLFAITQSVNMGVLQDMRDLLSEALERGETFETFRKNVQNNMAAKGWTGKRTIIDSKGAEKLVQTTPWRLKTIYRTNIQSSLNAGRFKRQVDNADDRPFLELIETLDSKTRSSHRAQSGSIQPITSRFWKSPNSWYPPNGFNCRGRTTSLTRAEAQSRGIKIKAPGLRPDPGFGGSPALDFFKPAREDFDDDIWEAGQDLEPTDLS